MAIRNVLFGTVLLGVCALVANGNQAPTKAKTAAPAAGVKQGHAEMLKEHHQAHEEHDAALARLGKWRVEHRRALAALASLQAAILEHDASLEELAEHARIHEDHIRHHEEEIHEHDAGGAGTAHEKLAESHKKMLDDHKKFQQSLDHVEDDHDRLMAEIQKLSASLKAAK